MAGSTHDAAGGKLKRVYASSTWKRRAWRGAARRHAVLGAFRPRRPLRRDEGIGRQCRCQCRRGLVCDDAAAQHSTAQHGTAACRRCASAHALGQSVSQARASTAAAQTRALRALQRQRSRLVDGCMANSKQACGCCSPPWAKTRLVASFWPPYDSSQPAGPCALPPGWTAGVDIDPRPQPVPSHPYSHQDGPFDTAARAPRPHLSLCSPPTLRAKSTTSSLPPLSAPPFA